MANQQGPWSRQQRQYAKEHNLHLIVIGKDGREARPGSGSLVFTKPVSAEVAAKVEKFMMEIMKETAEG